MIVISEVDFVRLNSISKQLSMSELDDVLVKADITNWACIPKELITMNSKVSYLRLSDKSIDELTIVYPQFVNPNKNFISVFCPLGKAFFGQKEGDIVSCELSDGQTAKFKILEVLYQPEDQGDFHL